VRVAGCEVTVVEMWLGPIRVLVQYTHSVLVYEESLSVANVFGGLLNTGVTRIRERLNRRGKAY
jgi:hypothetical protein